MKKKTLLFGTLLLMILMMSGCVEKKDAITTEDFISQAEGSGLKCSDIVKEYSDNPSILKATSAVDEKGWKVYFFTLDSDSSAKKMFESNKKRIEKASGGKGATFVDTKNYESYKIIVKDEYYYICYIGDSFLNVHVDKKYESDVKAFCDKIGY